MKNENFERIESWRVPLEVEEGDWELVEEEPVNNVIGLVLPPTRVYRSKVDPRYYVRHIRHFVSDECHYYKVREEENENEGR